MGSTRRSFTEEYKASAVGLVLDDGHSIAETANAERFKQVAELILAQPDAVKDSASEATLIDYYDAGGASVDSSISSSTGSSGSSASPLRSSSEISAK